MSNHTAVQRSVEEGTVRARVAFVLVIDLLCVLASVPS